MDNYIFETRFAISNELCDEIIDSNNCEIKSIYLYKKNEQNYLSLNYLQIDQQIIKVINRELDFRFLLIKLNHKYLHLPDDYLLFNDYQLLKFEKNKGYQSYSYDFKVLESNIYPYYEFIFFLNSVDEGGEVEIMGKTKIRAEKGKLLIFPSGWCFPYSHKMPISDDQYLIRGKIFKKD